MKKNLLIGLALVCGVALLGGGVAAWREFYDRKLPNFSGSFSFYVTPDMEPEAVLDTILASGKVRREGSLRRRVGALEKMRVGHYTLDANSSSMYAARMLSHGWQTPVSLSISGAIRSPKVLARKIGAQMLTDSATVADFLYSDDSLAAYGIDTTLLFTKVIPASYEVKWTAGVREIMDLLVRESDKWWTPERLSKARAQGLTRAEAVTLASIVDGETRYVPEQPDIAGVYLNRLRKGMKLQADPTVAYCYGYTLRRILKAHLDVDSPYNTYKYPGLPPGPISCPPKSCLEAVLSPGEHSYLFFCASPEFDGSHRFAVSYSDHLVNARAFQAALTKRLRERAVADK